VYGKTSYLSINGECKEFKGFESYDNTCNKGYMYNYYGCECSNDNEYYDSTSDECKYINNCGELYDDGECEMCNAYYYVDEDYQCQKNDDEHLMYYDDYDHYYYDYYYYCDMNYGWSYLTQTCNKCSDETCVTCEFDNDNEETCIYSINGTYINDEYVKGCSISCKSCIYSYDDYYDEYYESCIM